jgi:hypothetical protein
MLLLVSFLGTLLPLALGAALDPRQSAVTTVYKASGSAWYENLAVRANGQILLTRMDAGEVWTLDPTTKAASKLASVPGATSLSGITETVPDVFAVVGGNYSSGRNTAGSYGIWKLDLTGSAPKVSVVKMIKEATQLNGLTTVNNDTVLAGDAGKGVLYAVKMSTADQTVSFQDTTLAPAQAGFGVDGLRYRDGYAYYTNIFKNTLHKVAVDPVSGKATGKATAIYTDSPGDDLTFDADGNIYVATNVKNNVIKVTADGKYTSIAAASGDTACMFGRTEKDKNTLYVSTSSGSVLAITVK